MFFLLFGIFAINQFKGTFYSCHTTHLKGLNEKINDKWECLSKGGEWVNADTNFDNILFSMRALFEISSTSSWYYIMF